MSSDNGGNSEKAAIRCEIVRASEEGGQGQGSKYTVYHIEVTTELKNWTVLRRYKEFDALNQSILDAVSKMPSSSAIALPKLPAKKIFPMSSTDRSTVESRIVQLQDYLKKLLDEPMIFNQQMTESTKKIVDFLDHDGTLSIQVKCFSLESKVSQLTYMYRELQQSRELTEQLAVGQTRMIDMLQQRIEALESGGVGIRFSEDSSYSGGDDRNFPTDLAAPPTQKSYAAATSAAAAALLTSNGEANQPLPSPPTNTTHPPLSSNARSPNASEEQGQPSFTLSDNSNPSFLFRNSNTMPSSLQTALFQPGRSLSVGDNMLRGNRVGLGGNLNNQPYPFKRSTASVTIPTNAVKELHQMRRHSSEDAHSGGRRTHTNSFENSQPAGVSILNDLLSPSTPPSPSFVKHSSRNNSTNAPSNPWGGDNSRGLAFVSSPPNSQPNDVLPGNLVPKNEQVTPVDRRTEELIEILKPSPEAILHRKRVVKYTSRHIKQTLGAQCFPIGTYALKTYLPDDWLHVSAFLCRGQEQTWFMRVNEVLCKTSNSMPETGESSSHKISNVNFVNEGETRAIRCTTDGVNVDMTANSIEELYQVAFLEECDKLLGKNHLFKRSILLLKAWWLYETRAFSGASMLASISEFALSTMLLAVVNRHHKRFHHPLQILSMFFSVYSKLNWETSGITVRGVVDIDKAGNILGETTDGTSEEYLIPEEMIARYQQRCGQSRINASQRTASTASMHHSVDGGGISSPSTPSRIGDGAEGKSFDPTFRAQMFIVGNMNIQNPLDPGENLVHNKLSSRRASRFSQVIQAGAKNLQPVLSHLDKELERDQVGGGNGGFSTSVALFDNFFSNSWSRFGQGWRPDIGTTGGSSSPIEGGGSNGTGEWLSERDSEEIGVIMRGDIMDGGFENLQENLKFCSFLLEREITESALCTLSQVVLEEKGPMPVGEIGKMLQEATANPSLSAVLKESFGGLKKFLEHYPGVFLISADHPFNPHVYLRSGFTPEEQNMIANGNTDFLGTKTRKKTRRKRGSGMDSSSDNPSRDAMLLRQQQQRQQSMEGGHGGNRSARNSYSGVAAGNLSRAPLKPDAHTFVPRSSK